MAKVVVNRGLIVGLGVALGAALLALVFLLGREAGRKPAVPPSSPGSALPSTPGAPPTQASGSAPGMEPPTQTATLIGASRAVPPPSPSAVLEPERAAAVAFFDALDHLTPGQFSGDPQASAQEMVAGLGKGDSSGFDRLIAQAEEARGKLAALAPPPSCAGFHRESLAQLEESLVLMRANKKAMQGGESDALTALLARAQSLRARADALQREEKALRQRFGIAH